MADVYDMEQQEGNTPLTSEQSKMIDELRDYCESMGLDFMLAQKGNLRLVLENRSVGWDYDAGLAKVDELVEWYSATQPDGIRLEDVAGRLGQDKVFWGGRDVHGHPTLWFLLRKHLPGQSGPELDVTTMVYLINYGVSSLMGHPVEKFNLVFDLGGASRANTDIAFVRKTVSAIGAAWPGRTFKIMILSPGFVTRLAWNVVRPFLPARTVDRIKFFKHPVDDLAAFFTPDQLMACYGGNRTRDYIFAEALERGAPLLHPDDVPNPRLSMDSNASTRLSDDTSSDDDNNDGPSSCSDAGGVLPTSQSASRNNEYVTQELQNLVAELKTAADALEQTELDIVLASKRLDAVERGLEHKEAKGSRGCCVVS